MTIRSVIFVLGFVIGAAACGGNDASNARNDAGSDASNDGASCTTDSECGGNFATCIFPLADGCNAKGHCFHPTGAVCTSFIELCGCNGTPVKYGCMWGDDEHASGPAVPGKQYYPQDCPTQDGGL